MAKPAVACGAASTRECSPRPMLSREADVAAGIENAMASIPD
jgi:hypothetical protein